MNLNFLYGGAIVTQKSRVLIEDIDYIEDKGGMWLIGGTAVEYAHPFSQPKRSYRYTTLVPDSDY
jgi:hypothetical protein